MRYLAVGDIHGCYKALTTLAAFVPFQPDDMLITLGDYVDRGPESKAVLDWLIERYNKDTLVPLRGNHDLMMLRALDSEADLHSWLACGGVATLDSYAHGGKQGKLADVPETHWEFLEKETRAWYEIDSHFFVHANVYPDMPLCEQPDYMLYWEKFCALAPHESGKTMICGHTSQKSGVPRSVGHAVCIDTWVYGDGWLTCLDVKTEKYWQANQRGETRQAHLED